MGASFSQWGTACLAKVASSPSQPVPLLAAMVVLCNFPEVFRLVLTWQAGA